MIITPNLHFNGECKEALKLYEKAFKGKLAMCLRYCDADPADMSIDQLSDKEKEFIEERSIRPSVKWYNEQKIVEENSWDTDDEKQKLNNGEKNQS